MLQGYNIKNSITKNCGFERKEDLTGQRFNLLIFIIFHSIRNKRTYWLCRCDCGVEKVLDAASVKRGNTKSCGCSYNKIDKTINGGDIFNYLTVIEYFKKLGWKCVCRCGNFCFVKSHNLLTGKTKSCGCYHKLVMSKIKGKNHYNYNHNLSKEEREDNKNRTMSPKLKKWRLKVYKRDNYTCKCCGTIGGKLTAHHIHSYRSNKKLRYITSNGITLCVKCHKEFHHQFGYGNNTKRQFNKFKKSKI